nr:flocculation protein FLO11-like [Ipomoea batatas]
MYYCFSDSSITSAASFSKHAPNQEATQAIISRENRAAIDPKSNIMDNTSSLIQMQQGQDSAAAIPPPQQNQQQFIHPNTHYFQHPAAGGGAVPISSYYHPMYTGAPPSQQQMDPAAPQSSTQTINAAAAYKEALPPIYPTKPAPSSKPEAAAASVYRTPALFHQQFFGLSSQAPPPPAPATSANYGYDYSHPTQDQQLYYAQQHQVAPLPSQYQTMTPTTALLLSQATSHIAAENAMQQPKTSQPL